MKTTAVTILLSFALLLPGHGQSIPTKQIMKKMKATQLVWGPATGEDIVVAKMKSTKKWGMYTVYGKMDLAQFEFSEVIPPAFDSLNFFQFVDRFQIVKQNGRYGILLLPYEISDAATRVQCIYDKLLHKRVDMEDYVLFQEGGKWGLIDWFEEFVIIDALFESPDDVPLVQMKRWMVETREAAKKALDADLVIFDPYNGDGGLKARHRETKKWGMYQYMEKGPRELIPMQYDSINFYLYNEKFTEVYNNGKVGFYLSYWSYHDRAKETVACTYDDYRRVKTDGVTKLAVRRNGQWGWVDWLTGEEMSAFTYDSPAELPRPTYRQMYRFVD